MNEDPQLLALRQPPHSTEAEQSLIGAVLLDNQAFERVSWLPSNAFYEDRHRRLWDCLSSQVEASRPADVVTLAEALGADLEKVGGAAYLAALTQTTPTAINAQRYAEIVRDRALQRNLAQAATEIAESALAPGSKEIGVLADEAESLILQVTEASAQRADGPIELKTYLSRVFERLDELHSRDRHSDVTGVPTGFIDLDQKTAGLQPGDLIVVAGRPSMGKTAFAINVAEHVGVDCNLPVVIFSMEMGGAQIAKRLLSSVSRVDAQKLNTGRLNDQEWASLTEGIGKLHEQSIHIDEGGALNVLQVRSRARRIKRKHSKLGLVVIDYIQLMASKSQGENRATEIAEISRSLKAMAKELDCPVMVLSQLNRKVDDRPDRRPVMSDLRESGAIEQDADVILFLYREVVYTPDLPEDQRGCAELIIGKQRNGPIGTVKLTFRGNLTRFENFADDGVTQWPTRGRARKASGQVFDFKNKAAGPDAA